MNGANCHLAFISKPLIAANQAFTLDLQALAAGTFLAILSKET